MLVVVMLLALSAPWWRTPKCPKNKHDSPQEGQSGVEEGEEA
jgi:hypothetical protein